MILPPKPKPRPQVIELPKQEVLDLGLADRLRAAQTQPNSVYAAETLRRLPLAEAFYLLWGHLATAAVLHDIFDLNRGHCYEDQLAFADLVAVLTDAITRYHGSGNRALTQALQRQDFPTKARTVYGKLQRTPLRVSEAFLSTLTARLVPLFPRQLFRTELPASLAGVAVVVLDGKKIKNAAKRLLATRGRPGKLFGGKILAAYLPASGLAVALAADPDGEANDIRLMPQVMPLARQAVAGPRLWVADAQFCDLDQPALFTAEEGDHFLLRFTLRNSFEVDKTRPARSGTNDAGQSYREEWGWMGSAQDRRRIYVRRIVVERPGEEAVIVVTDLLEEAIYPAKDLLAVYLARWQIENVFQQITEVFGLEHLIGTAPLATVFQASLCLVIYNILQVVRGTVAETAPWKPKEDGLGLRKWAVDELSTEKIFVDMHEELIALHKTLQVEELLAVLAVPPTVEAVGERLRVLLGQAWTPDWKKARNKNPRSHQDKAQQSGAHTSVHKILLEAKQQKQELPNPHCGP